MERAIPSRTSGLAGGAGVAGVEATSESSPVGTAIACVSSTTGGAWSAISSESDRDIERSIDLMMCKREGRERTGRKSSLRQSPNDRGSTEEGAHGYKNVDFVIGARSLLRCFASLSLRTHTHSLAAALVHQLLRTVPPSISLASRQLFLSFVSLSSNVATRCVCCHTRFLFLVLVKDVACEARGTYQRTHVPRFPSSRSSCGTARAPSPTRLAAVTHRLHVRACVCDTRLPLRASTRARLRSVPRRSRRRTYWAMVRSVPCTRADAARTMWPSRCSTSKTSTRRHSRPSVVRSRSSGTSVLPRHDGDACVRVCVHFL